MIETDFGLLSRRKIMDKMNYGVDLGEYAAVKNGSYFKLAKANNTKVEEKSGSSDKKSGTADVVYNKIDEKTDGAKASYSINKMSAEDRATLVKQLKADQAAREKSLTDMVSQMFTGQGKAFGIATGDDSIWHLFAEGKFKVDEETKAQAKKDISEDGYWGVKETSKRLFDFASALAGDDVEKMHAMEKAMNKGFKQATKSWGRELPDISKQTLEAATKLFADYYNQ